MSHENKNITTNADGMFIGIHKKNSTAPVCIGGDTQASILLYDFVSRLDSFLE